MMPHTAHDSILRLPHYCSKLKDNSYYVTAGGASAQHDLDWINFVKQDFGFDNCTIEDVTNDHGVLSVQVCCWTSDFALAL